jgi:hypothetical protein
MTQRRGNGTEARLDKSDNTTQIREPVFPVCLNREVGAALEEADAGDFASETEVAALAKKWRLDVG